MVFFFIMDLYSFDASSQAINSFNNFLTNEEYYFVCTPLDNYPQVTFVSLEYIDSSNLP